MIIDEKRLEVQLLGKKSWKDKDAVGTVVMPTGAGKTYLGLLCAKENSDKGRNCIVIVPTVNLKEQWEEEIKLMNLTNIRVLVINGVALGTIKYHTGLLILDEVHKYKAPLFRKVFDNIKYNWVLGLTATLAIGDEEYFILQEKCPVCYTVTLEESLKNKFISDFQIYNLKIVLNEEDCKKVDQINREFFGGMAVFQDYKKAMKCLSDKEYRQQVARDFGWSEGEIFGKARVVQRSVNERMNFLRNHPLKVEIVKNIAGALNLRNKRKKIITFSQSINVCNELTDAMNERMIYPHAVSYHSKLNSKVRRQILAKFDKDVYSRINTALALNVGLNIPAIDMAILYSYTSSQIDFRQRLGRTLRITNDKNKKALIICLCCVRPDGKMTQEEKWLLSAQEGIPQEKIKWIDSINQIKE